MRPLTQALPGALAELLRDVPNSPGKIEFAWRAAVGDRMARVTSVRLEGHVLLVEATSLPWAREVTRSADVILVRLQTLLGPNAIGRLDVRTIPRD